MSLVTLCHQPHESQPRTQVTVLAWHPDLLTPQGPSITAPVAKRLPWPKERPSPHGHHPLADIPALSAAETGPWGTSVALRSWLRDPRPPSEAPLSLQSLREASHAAARGHWHPRRSSAEDTHQLLLVPATPGPLGAVLSVHGCCPVATPHTGVPDFCALLPEVTHTLVDLTEPGASRSNHHTQKKVCLPRPAFKHCRVIILNKMDRHRALQPAAKSEPHNIRTPFT